jgi:hypothetical protein
VTGTRGRSRACPSVKLVALPKLDTPPPDPLEEAARKFVRAFNEYVEGFERRFDRDRRYQLGSEGFVSRYAVPLGRARAAYLERAGTSSDPFHRQVAILLENSRLAGWLLPLARDGSAVRTLQNWLRDEPRLETQPAEPWLSASLPRLEFATARQTGSYTATLTLELKQRLPPSAALCVEVGSDVDAADVSLVTRRESSGANVEAIWKESRIWVILGEARLDRGDTVKIVVASAKPLARLTTVRIAQRAAERRFNRTGR